MENFFSNINLFKLLYKWRKHLLIIVVSSIILSFIFSSPFFITPKYKSTAVLYPTNISPYSSESPTEQMLQLFQSDDLKDSIITKFNLAKQWGLDSSMKNFKAILYYVFSENIIVKKGDNETVEITVMDTKPEQACRIANEMIECFNNKVVKLHREKLAEVAKTLDVQLKSKRKQIDSLEHRLDTLRKKYNILDYDIQTKEATRQHVKEERSGTTNSSAILKNLESYGGEFLLLGGYLSSATAAYNKTLTDYDKTISDLTKDVTYASIVSNPKISDKKCYPVRWLIILISAFTTLFVSVLMIGIIDNYQNPVNKS